MKTTKIAALAFTIAALGAACGGLDREGSIEELVDLGYTESQAACIIDRSVDEFGEDKVISDDEPTPEEAAILGEIVTACIAEG